MSEAVTVDYLKIAVDASADDSAKGLEKLEQTLVRLKAATKGGAGLSSVKRQLESLNTALSNLNVNSGKLQSLTNSLNGLSSIQKLTNLNSVLNTLKKIPELTASMSKVDLGAFATKMNEVAAAVKPLADEMQKVSNGFNAFPAKIQKLLQSNDKLQSSNKKTKNSFLGMGNAITWLSAKFTLAQVAAKKFGNIIAGWINKSTSYAEVLNLFNVAMGEYAKEAREYIEIVSEVMGIDPADWMRNQGVFMTLATGFGLAGDKAAKMSKNLTQLGYDLASFWDMDVSETMQKLQSGISGELEPLRRLGYDLSQAKLQQIAYAEGIQKNVSAMTQAEKAQLRYYAIMTQVTEVQGDMARTLTEPANQLRVFRAAINQAARALGNIFIPALNLVLPYGIAFLNVVREIADALAKRFGFEGFGADALKGIETGANGAGDALEDTTDAVKKLKKETLGIDELNILSDKAGTDTALGGDLGLEIPEYNFLGEAVNDKVKELEGKLRPLLEDTLDIVKAIGIAFTSWKVASGALKLVDKLTKLDVSKISAAVGSGILGVASAGLMVEGVIDAITDGLDGIDFAQILLSGGGLVAAGAGVGKTLGRALIGGAVGGLFAGVPMFITGIYDSIKSGIDWLSASLTAVGATAIGASIGVLIGSLGGPMGALLGFAAGVLVDLGILIYQKWDEIKASVSNFWSETSSIWGARISSWWSEDVSPWFTLEKWKTLFYNMGFSFGEELKAMKNYWTVTVPKWWSDNVLPWFTIERWVVLFAVIGKSVKEAVVDMVKKWDVAISEWYEEHVKKWLDPELWRNLASDAMEGLKKGFGDLMDLAGEFGRGFVEGFRGPDGLDAHSPSKAFEEAGIDAKDGFILGFGDLNQIATVVQAALSSAKVYITTFTRDTFSEFSTYITSLKTLFSTMTSGWKSEFSSLSSYLKQGFKDMAEESIDAIERIIDKLEDIPKNVTTTHTIIEKTKKSSSGSSSSDPNEEEIVLWEKDTSKYATGGFPQTGQLFYARENGPELVGTIGGSTAVVNNAQIVESVASGVYNAVVAAMSGSGSGDVNVVVTLDGEKIYNNQQKIKARRGYSINMSPAFGL